jgi:hypothetical protein
MSIRLYSSSLSEVTRPKPAEKLPEALFIPWYSPLEFSQGIFLLLLKSFNTEDIIEILISNKTYSSLIDKFKMLINDTETRGSQWYINSIKTYIDNLNHR